MRFHERRFGIAKGWLALSVSSLIFAGILAGLLVVARMPPFHQWITDPLFFKRCLIVHVELSLFVWFFSFLSFLYTQLPTKNSSFSLNVLALVLSSVGVCLLIISAGLSNSLPVLSNYLPVIDHPLFNMGLFLFTLGVAAAILQARFFPGKEEEEGTPHMPAAVFPGLRTAALGVLVAITTVWASWLVTSGDLEPAAYYEVLFWGGGHVLQFANEAGMLAVWILLTASLSGCSPISRKWASRLFVLLILPTLLSPLIAIQGTSTPLYRSFFTRIMQWGIFPVVLVFMAACIRGLWLAHRAGRFRWNWASMGLATSMALTLSGFLLGALIRGSNTLVPAHYHANIGAVTVSYMAVTFVLFKPLGFRIPTAFLEKCANWQPLVFGVGQTVFALGFGLAGSYGMGRKLYGSEQNIRHMGEYAGLMIMGAGGFLAIAGGVLFLWVVVKTYHCLYLKKKKTSKKTLKVPLIALFKKGGIYEKR